MILLFYTATSKLQLSFVQFDHIMHVEGMLTISDKIACTKTVGFLNYAFRGLFQYHIFFEASNNIEKKTSLFDCKLLMNIRFTVVCFSPYLSSSPYQYILISRVGKTLIFEGKMSRKVLIYP